MTPMFGESFVSLLRDHSLPLPIITSSLGTHAMHAGLGGGEEEVRLPAAFLEDTLSEICLADLPWYVKASALHSEQKHPSDPSRPGMSRWQVEVEWAGLCYFGKFYGWCPTRLGNVSLVDQFWLSSADWSIPQPEFARLNWHWLLSGIVCCEQDVKVLSTSLREGTTVL